MEMIKFDIKPLPLTAMLGGFLIFGTFIGLWAIIFAIAEEHEVKYDGVCQEVSELIPDENNSNRFSRVLTCGEYTKEMHNARLNLAINQSPKKPVICTYKVGDIFGLESWNCRVGNTEDK